jgi:hypothetical protein
LENWENLCGEKGQMAWKRENGKWWENGGGFVVEMRFGWKEMGVGLTILVGLK